jgi:hypothetical protein
MALAQPYPTDENAPAVVVPEVQGIPMDGGVVQAPPPQAKPGDPGYDTDPDIDGYDAEYDVYYDNVAAQGYDDGYSSNAYSYFESTLSPYGTWVDDMSYGRVWVPSSTVVGYDFFPYATGGYWVLTEYGWTWVSNWDWGWGPFHYGRWTRLASDGWCWIPGGGYVGWAPLPPGGVHIPPPSGARSSWRFVLPGHMGSRNMSFLADRVVPAVFAKTSVITNLRSVNIGAATVRVNAGPTGLATATGAGTSMPIQLRTISPSSLPQVHITPSTGLPLGQRPWVRSGAALPYQPRPSSIPIGPRPGSSLPYQPRPSSIPIGPRPGTGVPMPVPPRTNYVAPSRPGSFNVYIPSRDPAVNPPRPLQYAPPSTYVPPGPVPTYRPPSYVPPAATYSPPAYSPPVNTYRPPTYSPPVNTWRAPSYSPPVHSVPMQSAPVFRAPSPAPSYSRPSSVPSAPVFRPSSPGGFRVR